MMGSWMEKSMAEEKEKRILFVLQLPPIPAHSYFGSRRMNDQFPGGGNQPHSLPTRRLGLGHNL